MTRISRFAITVSLGLSLPLNAQAYEEVPLLAPLPPLERDERSIGWQWHYLDQDQQAGMMEKTDETIDSASYMRSDGCAWTRQVSGFAPASRWTDCPSSGTASVVLEGGPIWPLRPGAKFRYTGKAYSSLSSRPRKINRRCEVVKPTGIRIAAGRFDTYKVICKDRWTTRTWWLSPKVGTAVVYKQSNLAGKVRIQEMSHIVRPE